MANEYITKLKQLPPSLQAKLSNEKFLVKLDELDAQYGIKAVLTLINLLQGGLDYSQLADKLKDEYGFNDFLAEEIKARFGALITELGSDGGRPVAVAYSSPKLPPLSFSDADEAEVSKYLDSSQAPAPDYGSEARKVVSAFGAAAMDEVMSKRLENIVVSRIRGVRDDLETKESLMKSKKVGGLELSAADVDRLLGLIRHKDDLASAIIINPASAGQSRLSASSDRPVIEMEDGLPVIKLPEARTFRTAGGAGKLPGATDDVKINSVGNNALPAALPQPYIAQKNIPQSVLNAKTAQRPNLDDVKLEKRLMGPIEELENMTIIDFRRLAADPQAAVNKIQEKVELLGRDGFNQKISGIAAWQKSEVSRFYRLLGQLSMSESKPIEDVIKERLMSGKPTLSLDEFHAVMELNRALRY